jgi:hypothetical protein
MLGSYSGDNGELYILGYNAVRSGESQPTFRMNILSLYSGLTSKQRKK